MANEIRTTYSKEIEARLKQPIGDAPDQFMGVAPSMFSFYNRDIQKKIMDDDGMDMDHYYLEDSQMDGLVLPWSNPISADLRMPKLRDDIEPGKLVNDFKENVDRVEKIYEKEFGPGDEALRDYVNAVVFNPARRAISGWTSFRLSERLNTNGWFKEMAAYVNGGFDEDSRKKFAWADAHYPINRLVVSLDRAVQAHLDYFEATEKGPLTPEQEADYRQRILEEEVRTLHYLERTAHVVDPAEGKEIKDRSGVGNNAAELSRYSARGILSTYADTLARITGLKNGWPIEDLNALSSFKGVMDNIYKTSYYSGITPILRDQPEFQKGEEEYLQRLQKTWAEIEGTQVRDNDTRKALLTQMRDLIREGAEKGFVPLKEISPKEKNFCYSLGDIERKLARQLSPAELEVMQNRTYDAERLAAFELAEKDADRKRREEYEAREARERDRKAREEEAKRAEEAGKALREREIREDARNPHYDTVMERARSRREEALPREELERLRTDPNRAAELWYYDVLIGKRRQASQASPINRSNRPGSDQSDIYRYYMGKNGLTFDEALDLNLMDPDDRRQWAEDYYDDQIAHPIKGASLEEQRKNAEYYGRIDAAALKTFLSGKLPAMNPRSGEEIRGLSNFTSGFGRMAGFALDFGQDIEDLEDKRQPGSNMRAAYQSCYGTRENRARMMAQLQIPVAFKDLADVASNEELPLHVRALAKHHLESFYEQCKDKPLSEIDPMLSLRMRSVATGLKIHRDDLVTEGLPTERGLNEYMKGNSASPFGEAYLKSAEPLLDEARKNIGSFEGTRAMNQLNSGVLDLARVYQLDHIVMAPTQPPLGPAVFSAMTGEQRENTHRVFEQTLGNLVGASSAQDLLAVARGESPLDRFYVDGVKASDMVRSLYGDRLEFMTPAEIELATEAELMRALADPGIRLEYRQLAMSPNGQIVEKEPVAIGRPAVQRVSEAAPQNPDAEERFDDLVESTGIAAQRMGRFVPGLVATLSPAYLERRIAQANGGNGEPQAPEQMPLGPLAPGTTVHQVKESFLNEFTQASDILISAMGEEQPLITDYIRLQKNRAEKELHRVPYRGGMSYRVLMGLVDDLNLQPPGAENGREPAGLFYTMSDQDGLQRPFPLIDATKTAEQINDRMAAHAARLSDGEHPLTPEEDMQTRRELLAELNRLSGQLDQMERSALDGKRGQSLKGVFQGEDTLDRFLNREPGIDTVKADIRGRRAALSMGWPVEDAELIADFFTRRSIVNQALEMMPEDAPERMAYERAGKALDEVCDYLESTRIDSPESRREALAHIESYGDALFNDIVARTGQPEAGQLARMREQIAGARSMNLPAAAFRTAQECENLTRESDELLRTQWAEEDAREQERRERVREIRRIRREEAQKKRENEELREVQRKIADAVRFDAEDVGFAPDREEPSFAEREAEREEIRAERRSRRNEYEAFDSNNFYGLSFYENFESPEEMAADRENDPYLQNLEDYGNLLNSMFEERQEANYERYGTKGKADYFLEWEDTSAKLSHLIQNECRDIGFVNNSFNRCTDDMRAWLMAEYNLSYEEVLELNTADLTGRRTLGQDYVRMLESHPLNSDMSAEARRTSARYYGEMHRKALENLGRSNLPDLSAGNMGELEALAKGPSLLSAMGDFVTNLGQDSQGLYLSDDPMVRAAYVDAMGGHENFDRLHDQLQVVQAAGTFAQKAASGGPLRDRAFAKLQLELMQELMKGKTLSEAPVGMGQFAMLFSSALTVNPLPAEGAPSEQELQDYLDGKREAPFSQAYLDKVNGTLSSWVADLTDNVRRDAEKNLTTKLPDTSTIYNLPHISMDPNAPKVPDRTNTYGSMSEAQLDQIHVTFDRIFGKTLNSMSNGQVRLAALRGESVLDRFRIDGVRVRDLPGMIDLMGVSSPENYTRYLEGEILAAMADPGRRVEYVPLVRDASGAAVEKPPVTIPNARTSFKLGDCEEDPVVGHPEAEEVAKLTMGVLALQAYMSSVDGLTSDPDLTIEGTLNALEKAHAYNQGAEEIGEADMDPGTSDYYNFNHIGGGAKQYYLVAGTGADGKLTAEGKENLKAVKDYLTRARQKMHDVAATWDSRDPMLAEMIRFSADGGLTGDENILWQDMRKSYTYTNLLSQLGTLHMSSPGSEYPFDQETAMRAILGYPTGSPCFPLPQALAAGRQLSHAQGALIRAKETGSLTRQQDRLTRRMMVSEMDKLRHELKRMDALYASSLGADGRPSPMKFGYMHVKHIDKYLENDVHHSSSYYERGTKHVYTDIDAKRRLMANGWPVEDLDALAYLKVRREIIRDELRKPLPEGGDRARLERAARVLDEIWGELESTDIRNAEDRKKVLDHMAGYGDILLNDTILGGENNTANYRRELESLRSRELQPFEFLSAEELKEAKADYARFEENREDPEFVLSSGGPVTEAERAFLRPTEISQILMAQSGMEKNEAFGRNSTLAEARRQTQLFTAKINRFYARKEFLSPAYAEARRDAFEDIVQSSSELENALTDAEDAITNNGAKTRFTEQEEQTLAQIRRAKKSVSEMARLYGAELGFEARRAADMEALRPKVSDDVERYMADTGWVMMSLTDEQAERVREIYAEVGARFDFETGQTIPGELPERIPMAYNSQGELVPEVLANEDNYLAEEAAERERERERERQQLQREIEEAELNERYSVPAGEVMAQYSGEQRELFARFYEERGGMPERIRLSYDNQGRLRPAEFEEYLRSVRSAQRQEAARASEEAADAAVDLFAQGDAYIERELNRQERARNQRLKEESDARDHALAMETGDERYVMSIGEILNDAERRRQQAAREASRAGDSVRENGITPAEQEARQGLLADRISAARDAALIEERMEEVILNHYDAAALDREIRRLRPQWYEETYQPAVKAIEDGSSADARAREGFGLGVRRTTLNALLEGDERRALISELAEAFPTAQRDEIKRELLSLNAPLKRTYENQVIRPLASRIEELKGVQEPVAADGTALDPDEAAAYREALDYAQEALADAKDEVRLRAQELPEETAEAAGTLKSKQEREVLSSKPESYQALAHLIRNTPEHIASRGVLTAHGEALRQIMRPETKYSEAYRRDLGRMLNKMEEMGLVPSAGQDGSYAFHDVAQAKRSFEDAIRSGDPARIIETKRDYQKKREDMQELMRMAGSFSPENAPAGLSSAGRVDVPWEFASDHVKSSQINGVYLLYSTLKKTGVSIAEFVEDPEAAAQKMYARLDEDAGLGKSLADKSIGEGLGMLMAESSGQAGLAQREAAEAGRMMKKAMETVTESSPDEAGRAEDRLSRSLSGTYREKASAMRAKNRNPFLMTDRQRANEVQQLLNVVSVEDLKRNYDRMVEGVSFDEYGRRQPSVTVEQYVTRKAEIDYLDLSSRGDEIIREALKVENTSFDAVEFLQNRQKALSKLLILKAADAGTTEYEQLRYEVTHMAERYEMLRSAYPQLGLRELTAEERRQFEENAAVHEKEHAAAIQKLTRDQRSMVDTRLQYVRPDRIADLSRNNLILSASLYNEKDAADRLRREEQRRQQAQLRAEREQIRLEEERLRQEQEQARAREAAQASAEAARQQLKRREERLSEHAALPLTTRLREAIDELRRAEERYEALKKEPVDAEALKEAAINHREAISRADDLLHETIRAGAGNGEGSVTAEALTELLNAELGADRAKPILDKLRGGINESTNLMRLTAPERLRVLGALAGSLSPEAQAERLAADDAFTRVDGMQLTGSPYTLVRTRSGERLVTDPSYRAQVSQRTDFHATIDQVRGEMYHDFKGTRREWSELNAALDYADMTLRIPSADLRQRVFDNGAAHGSYMEKKQKTNVREQLKKPENQYMNDLTEGKGEVFDPPRADKTLQIRRMKSERMNLDPEYVKHVADILRRMERLGITREDAPAEEGNKVYAFHVLIKAQKELKDAIASKDRERILAATARVKEVRHEMDEMMRIAAENFHPTDYMDNLDVARNSSIPWEYGRDIVHSAQLNGLYLFGNLLKDSGISIDEFEKDPGAAIAQAENRRREQLTGINAYAKGKSAGTLFADADTEALANGATAGGQMATGQYMRAVGALVSTEPAKDPAQHARNDFLFRRIYEFNTDIDSYQNGRSFGNLKNGIGNKTTEGRNALRALVSVEEKDIDPERMFATIPIAPDGTRMEPFDLAEYYRRKPAYDYAAQGNRLESMLADAAKEHDRLLTKKRSYPEHAQIPIELNDVTKRNFHPYELLKARQEALTQLLTIRSFDRNQPGYAALEEEVLHMSERYETFRQAHPELKNLPELTGEQKAALTAGSKAYENLKNNREKLMAAEEKRIAREAGRQEKLFIDALKDLNKEVEKREKRLGKLMLDKNPSMEDVRRTSNSLNKAVEARESLKQRRALSLIDDYKAGKLPEAYVTEQLKTLSLLTQNQNRPPETLPLFGKQLDNRVAEGNRRRARELFLQDRLLENMGLTVKQSVTQPTDSMLPYLSALGIADPKPVAEAGQALQQPAGPQAAAVGGKAAVPGGQAAVPGGQPQDNINKAAEDQAMAENEIGEEPQQPLHEEPVLEEPPRKKQLNRQNPPHTDDEIAPKIRDLDFDGMMQRVGGQHDERQRVRRNSVNEINAGPRLEGDPEVRQQAQQAGPGKS